MKIKGQNLRLFLDNKAIAAATTCSIHTSAQTEDSSTKDDTNDWSSIECTGKSWDCSAEALFIIDSTETGVVAADALLEIGSTFDIEFIQTNGSQNRAEVKKLFKGQAMLTDCSITAGNKANATYSIQLQGVGALTVASAS